MLLSHSPDLSCNTQTFSIERETAMFMPGNVLIYGRHLPLLETRSLMLQRAGYKVSIAMELADAEQILRSEKIDLSILCHTLSSEQRSKALAKVEGLRPDMKKLLLAASSFPSVEGNAEEIFYTAAGPGALVATVNRLMGGGENISSVANSLH